MHNFDLNVRFLEALFKFVVPKHDVRIYLTNVCIEVHKDAAYYIATNGGMAAILKDPLKKTDGFKAPYEFLFPRDALASASTALKKTRNDYVECVTPGEPINLLQPPKITLKFLGDTIRDFTAVDYRYPDIRMVMPLTTRSDKEPPTTHLCDPALLAALQNLVAAAYGEKNPTIQWEARGKSAWPVWSTKYDNFAGIIMPLRYDVVPYRRLQMHDRPEEYKQATNAA